MKKNEMECWNCEKIFEFDYNDIVAFIDFGVGEFTEDYVVCPHCKEKQIADYNYYKK